MSIHIDILRRTGVSEPSRWSHLLALDLVHLRYLCAAYEGDCPASASAGVLRRRLAARFGVDAPRRGTAHQRAMKGEAKAMRQNKGALKHSCGDTCKTRRR